MSYITVATATSNSASSVAVAAFTTSGSNRKLIAGVGYAGLTGSTSGLVTGIARSGENFTEYYDTGCYNSTSEDHYTEAWYLDNPTTSSAAATVTLSQSQYSLTLAIGVFDNAASGSPTKTVTTLVRNGSGDPSTVAASVSVSGSGNTFAFAWGSHQYNASYTGTPSWDSGTAVFGPVDAGNEWCRTAAAYKTGTGSQSITWDTTLGSGVGGRARLIHTAVDASGSGQALTPSLFTNSNSFYTPTVSGGTASVQPGLFTNTNAFYAPAVSGVGAAKFTRSSGQYIGASDSSAITFPDGDWTIGVFVKIVDESAGDAANYIFSTGNYQAAGAVNIWWYPLSSNFIECGIGNNQAYPNIVRSYGWNIAAGWKLLIFTRIGSTTYTKQCNILASMPTDGSAVTTEESIAASPTTANDGAGFNIGDRNDHPGTRAFNQHLSRFFILHSSLTDLEIAKLAHGMTLADLSKTPVVYVSLESGTDTADDAGTLSTSVTNGPLTSVSGPAFGYAGGSGQTLTPSLFTNSGSFYAPQVNHTLKPSLFTNSNAFYAPTTTVDAATANDVTENRIYQRVSGTASVSMSGTYTGTTPTSVEVQLYASDGSTVLQTWTALTGPSIGGGNWSGTLAANAGGMYRFAARTKNGAAVLATSPVSTNLWGVGDLLVCLGSSSSVYWTQSESGTGFSPDAKLRRFNDTTSAWLTHDGNGAIVTLANALIAQSGYPVGVVETGVSGALLSDWQNTGSSEWSQFSSKLSTVGNKAAVLLIHVGSNDAAGSTITSKASHLAYYQTLLSNIRTLLSQASLPAVIGGSNSRPSNGSDSQFTMAREAEKDLCDGANNYYIQTMDLEVSGDNVHLTAAGFQAAIARMQKAALAALGYGTFYRGPHITSIVKASSTTFEVNLAHAGGTDFTPTSAITGFDAYDDSGALTISGAVRTSATKITLTVSRTIAANPVVRYLYGVSPISTGGGVFDNNGAGAVPLDLDTETPVAPLLEPGLFTDSDTFYAPWVRPGAAPLTPGLFTNANSFYAATVANNAKTYVMPTSDVYGAGWTQSTGGTLYGVVDEALPDAADYVESTLPAGYLEFGIPSSTVTEGRVHASASTPSVAFLQARNNAGVVLDIAGPFSINTELQTISTPVSPGGSVTRMRYLVYPSAGPGDNFLAVDDNPLSVDGMLLTVEPDTVELDGLVVHLDGLVVTFS